MTEVSLIAESEYEISVTGRKVTEVTERQGMNNLRGSTVQVGGMGRAYGLPSPVPSTPRLADLGSLFTEGQVWVCKSYGRADVASAMRRMNSAWQTVAAAGDWEQASLLDSDAELLLELAYPDTQPAEDPAP